MGIWVGLRVEGSETKDLIRIACIVDILLLVPGYQTEAQCNM